MATTPDKPAPARPQKAAPKRKKPKAKAAKKPPHRPPHVPTDQTRAVVQALAASGHTHDEICAYLKSMAGVKDCGTREALKKHYPTELKLSKMHQNLMVRQGLYRQAVGAPSEYDTAGNKLREEVKPNVTAQIFWGKCQAGWVEPQKHEHSGPEGKPIPVNISTLTDSQLEQLIARLEPKVGTPGR